MATVYTVTDTEDESYFTTCQGCDRKFDSEDRLPLNLDCQHTMCLTCVKRKSHHVKLVYCSTCPSKTNMLHRTAFDLKTNYYVLKIIASEQKQAKLKADYLQLKINSARNKLWCTHCRKLESDDCLARKHKSVPLSPFLNKSLDELTIGQHNLSMAWDLILGNLKESQNILQHVADALSSLLNLVKKRMEKNDVLVRKICANQTESAKLPIVPEKRDMSDEELETLALRLEAITTKMKIWDEEVKTSSSKYQLENFNVMENLTAIIKLEKNASRTGRQISRIDKLPLSFSATIYSQRCNDCVSALSFILMILAEEDARSPILNHAQNDEQTDTVSDDDDYSSLEHPLPGSADIHLRPRNNQMIKQQSTPLPPSRDDSDTESVSSERSRRSIKSLQSVKSVQSAKSVKSTQSVVSTKSAMSVQSEKSLPSTKPMPSEPSGESVQSEKSLPSTMPVPSEQSGESVQSEKSLPSTKPMPSEQSSESVQPSQSAETGRSSRHTRSVKKQYVEQKHEASVSAHYDCKKCGKSFLSDRGLALHMNSHPANRPKCTLCSKEFYTQKMLSNHMYTHTGEWPYKCPHCPKGFIRNDVFNNHIHTHTGEVPFKCPHCPEGFPRKSQLKQHIKKHSGERPFKCPHCSKGFGQRHHMERHAKLNCPTMKCKKLTKFAFLLIFLNSLAMKFIYI